MIGVLEHLSDPRSAVKSLKANKANEYFYFSVPMDSPSLYIEMASEKLFHRHLQGGHTHLYTEQSLNYLAAQFGFTIIAEWWFGADIVDWYRSLWVSLQKQQNQYLRDKLTEDLVPIIDSLQLQIDQAKKSSEVHMLWKKN